MSQEAESDGNIKSQLKFQHCDVNKQPAKDSSFNLHTKSDKKMFQINSESKFIQREKIMGGAKLKSLTQKKSYTRQKKLKSFLYIHQTNVQVQKLNNIIIIESRECILFTVNKKKLFKFKTYKKKILK